MILVSACLAGFNCRYDGGNKANAKIIQLVKEGKAVPVCPEQLGGLMTPRPAAEQTADGRVLTADGKDLTAAFEQGAREVLALCRQYGCTQTILRAKSPSCGAGKIYDGTFTGNLIDGYGVTAKLLKDNGIKVISEEDL